MLKAEIKKEVTITNKEIAQFLFNDGSLLDHMDEILEDMLYNEYKMDYDTRRDAVEQLTTADYVQILRAIADKMESYI